MKKNREVDAYLESAPAEQQALLKKLRTMIRKALPGTEEGLHSNMPVYRTGEEWIAGFSSRPRGAMLYVRDEALLDEFAGQLGKHRSGKSCLQMRASAARPLDQLLEVAAEILEELGRRKG